MRYFKYIVYKEDNSLKVHFGYVMWHRDLLPSKPHNYMGYWREPECLGGGMFMFDFYDKILSLYGYSSDYGKVDPKILNKIIVDKKDDIFTDLWYACKIACKDDNRYDIDDDYEFNDWKIKII